MNKNIKKCPSQDEIFQLIKVTFLKKADNCQAECSEIGGTQSVEGRNINGYNLGNKNISDSVKPTSRSRIHY